MVIDSSENEKELKKVVGQTDDLVFYHRPPAVNLLPDK